MSTIKRHIRVLKSVNLVEHRIKSMLPITFIDEDLKALDLEQDGLMVISIELANYGIRKVLVD